MSCKLFAHDLADDLLSNWRLGQRQMGLQRIVDEGLIPLSRLLGLSLEAPENRVIKIDGDARLPGRGNRSEEHTSELQSQSNLVCRLLLEKKKKKKTRNTTTCRRTPHATGP